MPLVEIRSGVGDDEADRWTADLRRIISQYAAHRRWTVEDRDQVTSPAGLRRAVLEIRGADAYARLRWMHGIHRVQRNQLGPPGPVRTSSAAVSVTPLDAETHHRRDAGSQANATAKIRTCNYPQDRVTDHRIPLTLYGLDRLVNAHLDRLADLLDAADDQGPDGQP